jgi:hypothetical protein
VIEQALEPGDVPHLATQHVMPGLVLQDGMHPFERGLTRSRAE